MPQPPRRTGPTIRTQDAPPDDAAPNSALDSAPAGSAPADAAPAAPPAGNALQAGKPAFLIAPRQVPGLQLFSTDFVAQQLRATPDIDIVGQIEPPRTLGLQSLDAAPASAILLARMTTEKARQLQAQAGARLLVERDHTLTFGLEAPRLPLPNPGVLTPLGADFDATLEVHGAAGPLAAAEVYVFGSVWPTQGVTDATGRVTLTIRGDTPDTIRAVYVKPKLDHWGMWVTTPVIQPDSVSTVTCPPLSDSFPGFPGQTLTGWGQRAMGLDKLPAHYDGAGIKIALIDSGAAETTHRNLRHVGPGKSVVNADATLWTADSIGHGSHCAGIIAGTAPQSGGGIRGFAPAAEIHVIQIFPGGKFSSLIQAIDYCIENEIDVANLSLGGGEPSQIVEERLIKAKAAGVACVVAAGNSGGAVSFPASTPHVLAVAALGKWGEFPAGTFHATQAVDGFASADGYFPAKFSCFGPEIDVCAPGVAIVSSLPDDGFGAWDGTSMAAPHVTGMAALVLAHHPDFKGAFAPRDAKRVERLFDLIKSTATPLPFNDPSRSGAGLPNLVRALGLETPAPADQPAAATPDVLAALRQLLSALNPPQGAPAAQAEPTPAAPPAAPDVWRNQPVPRGPAATTAPADPLASLREALQRAGLMTQA